MLVEFVQATSNAKTRETLKHRAIQVNRLFRGTIKDENGRHAIRERRDDVRGLYDRSFMDWRIFSSRSVDLKPFNQTVYFISAMWLPLRVTIESITHNGTIPSLTRPALAVGLPMIVFLMFLILR